MLSFETEQDEAVLPSLQVIKNNLESSIIRVVSLAAVFSWSSVHVPSAHLNNNQIPLR